MDEQFNSPGFDKNAAILIVVGLAVLVGGIVFFMVINNQTDESATPQPTGTAQSLGATTPSQAPSPTPTSSPVLEITTLKKEDIKVGTGLEAQNGDKVMVHYTGTFVSGQKFDSSVDRGQPFEFLLGAGQVIKGWDQGVLGMKVGGTRKLYIPSDLAYGETGQGPIPPDTPLIFEVQLLGVE